MSNALGTFYRAFDKRRDHLAKNGEQAGSSRLSGSRGTHPARLKTVSEPPRSNAMPTSVVFHRKWRRGTFTEDVPVAIATRSFDAFCKRGPRQRDRASTPSRKRPAHSN